jgi:hypothetical protein
LDCRWMSHCSLLLDCWGTVSCIGAGGVFLITISRKRHWNKRNGLGRWSKAGTVDVKASSRFVKNLYALNFLNWRRVSKNPYLLRKITHFNPWKPPRSIFEDKEHAKSILKNK